MAYDWQERDEENGSWLFLSPEGKRGLTAFAPKVYERARPVSLGWPSRLEFGLIKELQLISWTAFHWSLPGRDDLVPQQFRMARPVEGGHRVSEGALPPSASEAAHVVMRALQKGGPPKPPIFRIDFFHEEVRPRRAPRYSAAGPDGEIAAGAGAIANWGRRYDDLARVKDLPYGNVGISLSRGAVVRLEDELVELIARDSLISWELGDLRDALRRMIGYFSGDASSGGANTPSDRGSPNQSKAA